MFDQFRVEALLAVGAASLFAYVFWGPKTTKTRTANAGGALAGLQNVGNSCFLNAVLQALASSPAVIKWLTQQSPEQSPAHKKLQTALIDVIHVVNRTHRDLRSDPFTPAGVIACLSKLGWLIRSEEQDTHEMFYVLMSTLQEEPPPPPALSAAGLGAGDVPVDGDTGEPLPEWGAGDIYNGAGGGKTEKEGSTVGAAAMASDDGSCEGEESGIMEEAAVGKKVNGDAVAPDDSGDGGVGEKSKLDSGVKDIGANGDGAAGRRSPRSNGTVSNGSDGDLETKTTNGMGCREKHVSDRQPVDVSESTNATSPTATPSNLDIASVGARAAAPVSRFGSEPSLPAAVPPSPGAAAPAGFSCSTLPRRAGPRPPRRGRPQSESAASGLRSPPDCGGAGILHRVPGWPAARRRRPPGHPRSPFTGSVSTQLTCLTCDIKYAVRWESFESLSLPLPALPRPQPLSIPALLAQFTAAETVHDVTCERCHRRGRFAKRTLVAKLPAALCIHLPRTTWQDNGQAGKRGDHVSFFETLNMFPYTYSANMTVGGAGPGRSPSDPGRHAYRLTAVIVHSGGASSGHFVTYRRRAAAADDRWFYTSDTVVSRASRSEVLAAAAYMLFYDRVTVPESDA